MAGTVGNLGRRNPLFQIRLLSSSKSWTGRELQYFGPHSCCKKTSPRLSRVAVFGRERLEGSMESHANGSLRHLKAGCCLLYTLAFNRD
jgi:hypothetical protein